MTSTDQFSGRRVMIKDGSSGISAALAWSTQVLCHELADAGIHVMAVMP